MRNTILLIIILSVFFLVSIGPVVFSYHDQPQPMIPTELQTYGVGEGQKTQVGLNVYFNPQFVSNGYILKDGDSVCVGDQLYMINDFFSGEFFGKGGPSDTPPVVWVDDLDEIKTKQDDPSFQPETFITRICSARYKEFCKKCVVNATIFCSSDCDIESSNTLLTRDNSKLFDVYDGGDVSVNLDCNVVCVMFIKSLGKDDTYKYAKYHRCCGEESIYWKCEYTATFPPSFLELNFTTESIKHLSLSMNVKGVHQSTGPKLELIASDYNPEIDALYLKTKNVGDMTAKIDDVSFDSTFDIIYIPKEIKSGEEIDILVKTRAEEMTIKYRSDELGCLKNKEFEKTFSLVGIPEHRPCTTDADCLSTQVCCENLCRNKEEGFCDDTDRDGIPDTWVPI